MNTYNLNGATPSLNGNAPATNGQEVSFDPAQIKLPWVDELLASAPTAKTESPKAETNANIVTKHVTKATAGSADLKAVTKKRARYRETGHAINVEKFRVLKQIIIGFDDSYVQGNPLYTVASLDLTYTNGNTDLQKVTSAKNENDLAIDQMVIVFKNLKDMSTRSKNIFMVSGVPDEAIKRCVYLNHEIQGSRVVKIKKEDPNKHISASHQSRTQLIQHVDGLIELFSSYSEYAPLPSLDVAAWTAKRNEMYNAQQAANVTDTSLKLARLQRNISIYGPITGLVDVGNGVKKTVLGIFGFKSPQFAMVKGIEFRKIKDSKNL